MIDLFTLALTHGLIALALWRLLFRADLDLEESDAPAANPPWRKARASADEGAADD